MKVLITGVNGFLGKSLVTFLTLNGVDILGTSLEEKFVGREKIEYIQANLSEDNFSEKYFKDTKNIDAVIHCGAYISYNNHDLNVIKSNCLGLYNIVQLCQKNNIKKIVFISSIQVIGEIKNLPINEEHELSPKTLYHSSKVFGENYLQNLNDMKRIIFRLTSPVGKNMPTNKIMKVFVKKCMNNEDIILLGKGERIQNYIDIQDIVRAISFAIKSNLDYGVYNLAGKESISNYDLAIKCKEVLKSNSKIKFSDIQDKEEKDKWIVDISKIKKELEFEPVISLAETIKAIEEEIEFENLNNK